MGMGRRKRRQGPGISSEIETINNNHGTGDANSVARGLASHLRLKPRLQTAMAPVRRCRQGPGISSEIETRTTPYRRLA